jgi:hypothetical protein
VVLFLTGYGLEREHGLNVAMVTGGKVKLFDRKVAVAGPVAEVLMLPLTPFGKNPPEVALALPP